MNFIFISNDPQKCKIADICNVSTIMIDLEINGKKERQGHLNTRISASHNISDILKVSQLIDKSELMVRVNPIGTDSITEISKCIELGCDRIMLPMFKSAKEVEEFLRIVDNKVKINLLFETVESLLCVKDILSIYRGDIHFGLNDLHIQFGYKFIFEVLFNNDFNTAVDYVRVNGVNFGIGGIARVGHGKIPSEIIYNEYINLGATSTILSRDFDACFGFDKIFDTDLRAFYHEIKSLNHVEQDFLNFSKHDIQKNRSKLFDCIQDIISN